MWVRNEVLAKDRSSYIAAEFSTTKGSRFKSKLIADAARGKINGSSAEAQKYSDAWRIYCAVDHDLRVLSTSGGNKPPVEDLMDCPACANGILAINVDACMKMRCAQHNSKSAAPPLGTFGGAFGPIYIDPQGNAVDASMDTFRRSREQRLRGGMRIAPERSLYSSTACSSNFRAEADNHEAETSKVIRKSKIPGVAAPVCHHGMAIVRMIRMITTAGERAELAQYFLERILHECGAWPQPGVFGPPPVKTGNQTGPPPKFLISDLACKVEPRIMNETPQALNATTVALGIMHGACLCALIYHITNRLHNCAVHVACVACPEHAHPTCRLKNSLKFKPGSASVDGETVERFWKLAGGAAYAAEKMHVSHFAETLSDAFSLVNWKMLSLIPSLLTRTAQRAHQAFVRSRKDLCDLCHELTTQNGVKVVNGDVLNAWTAKVFLNTSEDYSKALSAGAVLFGAIEELEAKKLVSTSLQLARLYGTAGETQVLKRTQRLINQLEKVVQKARLEVLQGYQPTSSDAAAFRTDAAAALTAQIIHKEAELHAVRGGVQRGTNARVYLHPKEKARNRKAIENLSTALMEMKGKLALHHSKLSPQAAAQVDSEYEYGLPTAVMMKVISPYHEMHRNAEALVDQLPNKLKTFR
jgi:hypothetical protein